MRWASFTWAEGRVLNTVWFGRECGQTTFSEAERHHARVAYSRAPGNRDPDSDPVASALLPAPGVPPVKIRCR
jgi:hypothetical protein